MNQSLLEKFEVKAGFTTRRVPNKAMAGLKALTRPPEIGDVILAEVIEIGHHQRIELRTGVMSHIFPGDLILGAFGNRYATDQFEAHVPAEVVSECDLVSVGGVLGQVVSR